MQYDRSEEIQRYLYNLQTIAHILLKLKLERTILIIELKSIFKRVNTSTDCGFAAGDFHEELLEN
jgi:hypothetical protein